MLWFLTFAHLNCAELPLDRPIWRCNVAPRNLRGVRVSAVIMIPNTYKTRDKTNSQCVTEPRSVPLCGWTAGFMFTAQRTGCPEHKQWKQHLLNERGHLTLQTGGRGSGVGGCKMTALWDFNNHLQLNYLIRLHQHVRCLVWTSTSVTFLNWTAGQTQKIRKLFFFSFYFTESTFHLSVNLHELHRHSLW